MSDKFTAYLEVEDLTRAFYMPKPTVCGNECNLVVTFALLEVIKRCRDKPLPLFQSIMRM